VNLVPNPSETWRKQHKFTWIALLKILPLAYHHSHFLATTLDFTSFFTMAFLGLHPFFTAELFWIRYNVLHKRANITLIKCPSPGISDSYLLLALLTGVPYCAPYLFVSTILNISMFLFDMVMFYGNSKHLSFYGNSKCLSFYGNILHETIICLYTLNITLMCFSDRVKHQHQTLLR